MERLHVGVSWQLRIRNIHQLHLSQQDDLTRVEILEKTSEEIESHGDNGRVRKANGDDGHVLRVHSHFHDRHIAAIFVLFLI